MDITERKQAEEVLQQRLKLQDQLARTATSVPGMIYSLLMRPDGSTRMPYVSGALSEIFDLQPQDVVEDAAAVFSLIHPDDLGHLQATMAESARTLNPWRDDFRVCRPRLGEIWVEGNSVPRREPDGSILWHGFVQNITERKRAQAELENVHQQLLEASRRAGMAEIATSVLHNVGNVLNSINVSTGLVAESVKKSRASSLGRERLSPRTPGANMCRLTWPSSPSISRPSRRPTSANSSCCGTTLTTSRKSWPCSRPTRPSAG
jgi:PAS domain S-box-containing protein